MATPITVANPGFPGSFGSPFGVVNAPTLTAGQNLLLPAGYWTIHTGSNDTCQMVVASGNTLTIVAANASMTSVSSDGQNVSLRNSGTVGTPSTYIRQTGAI